MGLQQAVLDWNNRACLLSNGTAGCRPNTLFFDFQVRSTASCLQLATRGCGVLLPAACFCPPA